MARSAAASASVSVESVHRKDLDPVESENSALMAHLSLGPAAKALVELEFGALDRLRVAPDSVVDSVGANSGPGGRP